MKSLFSIFIFLCISSANIGYAQEISGKKKNKKEPEIVKELTESLLSGITNDSLKVLKIYKWITNNISYDYSGYMSGEPIRYQSPELVCRKRKTTCTGYSNLMVEMLRIAGIKAFSVEGFTHDFNLGLDSTKLSSDHAWVAFSIDGKWMLADPTWDAGETGIFRVVKTTETKKTFWQRLKSFRLKHLFSKKKREKNKITTRTRVTYKMGFIRRSTLNYIFIDPNIFVKTHLANVAHIQMKTVPISVEQFCDSTHALGEKMYDEIGYFNYNTLNEAYFNLERPQRLLWLSDSSLNYHALNHGDKALNAHNYLAYFYGEKSSSIHTLKHFISISDTVLIHAAKAIRINQKEFIKKRAGFNQAFQSEKKLQFAQQKQVNFIRERINSNTEIYRKGRSRINLKEKVTIDKIKERIILKYGISKSTIPPMGWDTIPETKSLILELHSLRDTISFYQNKELQEGMNYSHQLDNHFKTIREKILASSSAMYEGAFLNEQECLSNDELLLGELTSLTNFLRDSVNCFLGTRKSYALLFKMDQLIKSGELQLVNLGKKDTLFQTDIFLNYAYSVLTDLLQKEKEIINERLKNADKIENHIKNKSRFDLKEIELDMKDLVNLKTIRQAYLSKLLNNKYKRSIKVYNAVISNANKWKALYKTKLKNLEH